MKTIVVSGINLRSGGTLSILQDCLLYLQNNLFLEYRIIALVHKKELFIHFNNIEFIEFPNSINNYLFRIYYEYFYFKHLSNKFNPHLWLSLHDMTPTVSAKIRAVYCHNPSPFYKSTLREFFFEPMFFIFNIFYSLIYRINIHKNNFVIVQQDWIRKKFLHMYGLQKIIVAHPNILLEFDKTNTPKLIDINENITTFFYPTLPRIFKNIECICEASKLLIIQGVTNFEVIITIDALETRYSRYIVKKYHTIPNIKFIGRIKREEVFALYKSMDCLVFPSKLETWGLPLSECKIFNKPILVADLSYAHETIGDYNLVSFFNPKDPEHLSEKMNNIITKIEKFSNHKAQEIIDPYADNWSKLFSLLLNEK